MIQIKTQTRPVTGCFVLFPMGDWLRVDRVNQSGEIHYTNHLGTRGIASEEDWSDLFELGGQVSQTLPRQTVLIFEGRMYKVGPDSESCNEGYQITTSHESFITFNLIAGTKVSEPSNCTIRRLK